MKFCAHFNLRTKGKEFVNIELGKDTKLFVDPVLVIKYNNVWSSHISDCYGNLINFIKLEKDEKAKEIINGFSEYSFTHLGYTLKKKIQVKGSEKYMRRVC